jgi:pimeloyl-ACP methyl ester carboxylesterase
MKLHLLARAAGAVVAASTLAGAAPIAQPALKTTPCAMGQTRAPAICGSLTVFENRATRSGRTIEIHFIDILAKHASHRAIAYNPGGPGAWATANAADFADATDGPIATLRDRYDILLVDNRGTGDSAAQQCDFSPMAHPELYFRQIWPDEIVRSCRNSLAATADLSLYTTSMAADDLDDVRAALGYPKLVLFGGSYGTQFYLDYARRHPDAVESMVLEGVAPPHFYILPLPMAGGAQTAIENLERACREDTTCAAHFPDFAGHFDALARRFDAGPVTIENMQLSKEVFAETIRHALYFPAGAAYVPVTVERAYRGDYRPLDEMVVQVAQFFANNVDNGLNLSVTCAEDIPFITPADVAKSSAGTFEGDARVAAQQRACKLWNVNTAPASYAEPVRSNAPILMISGSDDPATPPQYAREALAYLPNARIMLVPGASHDSDLPTCVDTTMVAFVRARSAANLDLAHCAAAYQRPAFETLAYDEPAPGEDAALRERFTKILYAIMRGSIDRSQLTPAFSRQVPDAMLRGLASDLAHLGSLRGIVYKGVSGPAGARVYKYLMRFDQMNVHATFVLNASGAIAGVDLST